jgi:hypothetical protein
VIVAGITAVVGTLFLRETHKAPLEAPAAESARA